jgi:hypothetical protein
LYCRASSAVPGGSYSVSLQGKKVLDGLDPGEGGAAGVVHKLSGIKLGSSLDLVFSPSPGKEAGLPLVCGVELIYEGE